MKSIPEPPKEFYPLLFLLDEIDRCIKAQLYYAAFSLTLTLPDVCVSLTFKTQTYVNGVSYKAFLEEYALESEIGVEPEVCYQLRGGVLHRGNAAGHSHYQNTNFVLSVPQSGGQIHGGTYIGAESSTRALSLTMFHSAMRKAVLKWIDDNKDNSVVLANLPNMLRPRNGLSPFFGNILQYVSGPD